MHFPKGATMISNTQRSTIDLSAGPIDYIDAAGDGPTVVLLHGVLMNHTVWREVIAELTPTFRCITPTLPLGAHRQPMRPGADLSIDGIALLVAEFLERLDLYDVTLIMNDWGGPQLLVDHDRTERISRLADLLPDGRMVELTDSYTVVPRDQPQQLAEAVRAFITSTAARPDNSPRLGDGQARRRVGFYDHGEPTAQWYKRTSAQR
jgi:hypothetical protein